MNAGVQAARQGQGRGVDRQALDSRSPATTGAFFSLAKLNAEIADLLAALYARQMHKSVRSCLWLRP